MVATFADAAIAFSYPDNWSLQDDGGNKSTRCVTVQSPGSGFWMLQCPPPGTSLRLAAAEMLNLLKQEYDELEVAPIDDALEGVDSFGYDIQFYCLDFVVHAQIRSFQRDRQSFVVLCQAEDREFTQLALVFHAITTSLLQHLARSDTD